MPPKKRKAQYKRAQSANESVKPPVELPAHFQIGTSRWWTGAVISGIAAVILAGALFGVPQRLFGPAGSQTGIWQTLAVVGVPIAAFCTFYYVRAALRPDHVTISQEGVSTPSWELTWDEIKEVSIKGEATAPDGQVQLWVTQDVFSRVGPRNRWCSGRPLRLGGMVSKIPVIQLQQGAIAPPKDIAETIELMRKFQKRRSRRK